MNNTTTGKGESITTAGSILQIEKALAEDVSTSNSRTGYVMISYAAPGRNEMVYMELLQLNVDWDTILLNQFVEPISLCTIRRDMRVNAEFSSVMTRNIPPETKAHRIIAFVANPLFRITTDQIISMDVKNGFLNTGSPEDVAGQMRFSVSRVTEILDQNDNPISFCSLYPGQLVRIEHANFQTAGIPPQSVAFRIKLI
jgi:hypothetical protein